MRRWNGWGDEGSPTPVLSADAARFIAGHLGGGTSPHDASLDEVVAAVPPSRLPAHPLLSLEPEARLRRSRGQSLPDWIALRSGRIPRFPDAVARPVDDREVGAVVALARDLGASVIPYGGGTSVVGGVTASDDRRPIIALDTTGLGGLRRLDPTSGLATFGSGAFGPDIERALRDRGWTLGHFPQSWEYSTLGGWVAARSAGQQSLGVGRIEDLFAGGRLVAPAGTLDLAPHPASAAGPDLRALVLGSEGRLGVLTDITVRSRPAPEREAFSAAFLPDWDRGLDAIRELAQAGVPVSMARLSSALETSATLAIAGRRRRVAALLRYAEWRGSGDDRCLLILGATGRRRIAAAARAEALAIVGRHGGVGAPGGLGNAWARSRFRGPDLREAAWTAGYAIDTLETAADWASIPALSGAILAGLRGGLDDIGERVLAFVHVSHVYTSGSSLYVTYAFRLATDPDESVRRWRVLKTAASEAISAAGATISHQHGVGRDHRAWITAEKGELGLAVLADVARRLDPDRLMNPDALLPPDQRA